MEELKSREEWEFSTGGMDEWVAEQDDGKSFVLFFPFL